MASFVSLILVLIAAPLYLGIILKVKAFFAGKKGPPLLIKYYTLIKLVQKGSVYSTSSSLVFKLGPVVSFAASIFPLFFFPFAGNASLFSFTGDVVLVLYVMGIGRFFTVIAALDTASPFEGMGAAREVFFSTLAELALFAILILFYRLSGSLSFNDYFHGDSVITLAGVSGSLIVLVVVALFMVLLTENSRVPVDDPATHLELTMIHEVMILDHSGPDLALIELGAFYKMFFYAAFVIQLICPFTAPFSLLNILFFFVFLALVYVAVGIVESIMARFKMDLVPKFILTSFSLVFFAVILTMGVLQ
ncbi:MAG: NADH-quinone oxidoreductase subunit H [Desulfobulbus sp.]|nr:NADH-quinone oxidoreductase subunit H [Desulfobulbus sp.]